MLFFGLAKASDYIKCRCDSGIRFGSLQRKVSCTNGAAADGSPAGTVRLSRGNCRQIPWDGICTVPRPGDLRRPRFRASVLRDLVVKRRPSKVQGSVKRLSVAAGESGRAFTWNSRLANGRTRCPFLKTCFVKQRRDSVVAPCRCKMQNAEGKRGRCARTKPWAGTAQSAV